MNSGMTFRIAVHGLADLRLVQAQLQALCQLRAEGQEGHHLGCALLQAFIGIENELLGDVDRRLQQRGGGLDGDDLVFRIGLGLDHFFQELAAGEIDERLRDQAVGHEQFFLEPVLVGCGDRVKIDLRLADAVGQESGIGTGCCRVRPGRVRS